MVHLVRWKLSHFPRLFFLFGGPVQDLHIDRGYGLHLGQVVAASVHVRLNDADPLQVERVHVVRVLGQNHQVSLLADLDAAQLLVQVKLPGRVDGVRLEGLVDGHTILWAVGSGGIVSCTASDGSLHVGERIGLTGKGGVVL